MIIGFQQWTDKIEKFGFPLTECFLFCISNRNMAVSGPRFVNYGMRSAEQINLGLGWRIQGDRLRRQSMQTMAYNKSGETCQTFGCLSSFPVN